MAEKDKLYKLLNPIWIQYPVNTLPLAPSPTILNGKEIFFSISSEPDINIPLEKRFKSDYPTIKWKAKKPYLLAPVLLDEEMKTVDGQIQGVAW
ncbi:MAG: hypothetical protein V3R96_06435 [Dehalococcoidales bacterium]